VNDNLLYEIFKLNEKLNKFKHGIIIGEKFAFNEQNVIPRYFSLDTQIFEKYQTGACWDFTEYEAKVFEEDFGFTCSIDKELTEDKTFSMYYMVIMDKTEIQPTHTWLSFKYNNQYYLFESHWESQKGIHVFETENDMLHFYAEKMYEKNNYTLDDYPMVIVKYERNDLEGKTPHDFMLTCINNNTIALLNYFIVPQKDINIDV
jgi:hypothetical protein